MEEAEKHCSADISKWHGASNDGDAEPDVLMDINDRLPQSGVKGTALKQRLLEKLAEYKKFIYQKCHAYRSQCLSQPGRRPLNPAGLPCGSFGFWLSKWPFVNLAGQPD